MKLKKIAFLFFCGALFCTIKANSQLEKDSIDYFTNSYNKNENTDLLIKAYKFFEKDKEKYLKQKYYPRVLYDVYYLAMIEYKLGSLSESEYSTIKGVKILDVIPNDTTINKYGESFFNHLGRLKREMKDYKTSKTYYLKALNLANTKWDSALVYNNISINYIEQKKYKKAKSQLQFATKSFQELKDSAYWALSLNNLGLVESKLNRKNGLPHLFKGLQIRKKIKSTEIYESYKYIAEYYLANNDRISAIKYANKGHKSALELNRLSYKKDALGNLIILNQTKYGKEFLEVITQIDSIRSSSNHKFSTVKYDVAKERAKTLVELNKRKEAELNETKAKLNEAEAQAKSSIFLFGLIIVLLGATFIFNYLKNRHKKDNLKTRFDTERQISKKLHDEVANSVFHTMSKQQSKSTLDIELIDDLEEIYLKTRDISKTSAALKITEKFDEDLKDLVLSYKTDTVNIFTRNMSEMPWYTLSDLKKETVYRVLQELMINMTKHSNASLVTLQFQKEKRKIAIHYMDNGVGTALNKSNGLQNMENRIKEIGGTIIFESETNKGFQVKMTV